MDSSSELAVRRTFLAHERTLMAWIRTSTSLISFGFTIYKFFEYLAEAGQMPLPRGRISPRQFAMIMIGIGVFTIAIGAFQYTRSLRLMRQEYGSMPRSLAGVLAILLSILGLALLIAVWLRD